MYRQPDLIIDADLEAREAEAARALGERRHTLRARAIAAGVVIAIGVGLLAAIAFTKLQWDHGGVAFLRVSGMVGCGVAMALVFVAVRVTRLVVASATPAWLDELSLRHRVPRTRLEELERELRSLG